jgi:hypothetical protein
MDRTSPRSSQMERDCWEGQDSLRVVAPSKKKKKKLWMYWIVAQTRQGVAPSTYLPLLSETRRSKFPWPSTLIYYFISKQRGPIIQWRGLVLQKNVTVIMNMSHLNLIWIGNCVFNPSMERRTFAGAFGFGFFLFLFDVAAGGLECHFELPETVPRVSFSCLRH